jgi:23S rRNA pseudouridine1911/1915/1917 synthase
MNKLQDNFLFELDEDKNITNNMRLDRYLTNELQVSRNQIERLIKTDKVKVNSKVISKTGHKLIQGDKITIDFPLSNQDETTDLEKCEAFDIDIIYEDDDILVINKPKNLVIHKAPSVTEPTLVDWLKYKNISLSTLNAEIRHGIVHRLDKNTTGAMVVAKTNIAHERLSAQLQDKSMGRYYLGVINQPIKENTIVDKPIGRNRANRAKMGINQNGKVAKTAFSKVATLCNSKYELVVAKLFTGRTHQIRVHLNAITRYIIGDDMYRLNVAKNSASVDDADEILLHAYLLYLIHPTTNEPMNFIAPLSRHFDKFLETNIDNYDKSKSNKEYIDEILNPNSIIDAFADI